MDRLPEIDAVTTSTMQGFPATQPSRLRVADWLFSAYILTVPFGSAADLPGPLPGAIGNLSSLLGAMCIAAFAILWVIEPTRREATPTVVIPLWLAFLGWAALTGFWSVNPEATSEGVFVLGSLIVLSASALSISFPRRQRQLFLGALATSALVTGSIAVVQWATGSLGASRTAVDRFALSGGDPNITAASLLLPFAVAFVGLLDSGGSDTATRASARLFYGLASAAALIGIILTASRGGLAAVAAIVGIVLLRHARPIFRAGVVLAGSAMFFVIDLPFQARAGGLTGRASIWNIGLITCSETCWVGSGLNTFPDQHQAVALARPELSANQFRFEAHNIWIGSLVELGFGATLLLSAIVVLPLGMTFAGRDRLSNVSFAGLAGVAIANLFVSNVEFKYFWLALVVASIASHRDSSMTARTLSAREQVVGI